MSYPFDRTQIETARLMAAEQVQPSRRRLARRMARQARRVARAI